MIIRDYNYGNFEGNPFVIGTTSKNKFFPVYALFESHRRNDYYGSVESVNCLSEHLVRDVFMYRKPENKAIRNYSTYTRYPDMINSLQTSGRPEVFQFLVNDEPHFINIMKGYISDKFDNILMLLTCKSEFIKPNQMTLTADIFKPNYSEELNNEKLQLFVSNEFITNEIYKNVYKKVDAEIIQKCLLLNIDVFFTSSEKITNSVYQNEFEVSYNNLTELHEHLNSGIGNNLFFDESIYHQLPEEETEELPF